MTMDTLYPSEADIAALVLGKRAKEWSRTSRRIWTPSTVCCLSILKWADASAGSEAVFLQSARNAI